jgi:hypothetical protein
VVREQWLVAFPGYSDYLGGGQRRFGNPYLGVRAGGALEGTSAWACRSDTVRVMARRIALLISLTLLGLSLGRLVYHYARLSEPYALSVMR